jgi:hypothetical protein
VIRRAVGDRAGEGTTLHNLGHLALAAGDNAAARAYFKQALALSTALGMPNNISEYERSLRLVDAREAEQHEAPPPADEPTPAVTTPVSKHRRALWPFRRA